MPFVYNFDDDKVVSDKKLLGGKGAGLVNMTRIGLPVPPGFVITIQACNAYYEHGGSLPDTMMGEVRDHMRALEATTGKGFGDAANPLLVSVRSGAAVSMPGMMDTILNLGLNDEVVEGMAAATGNRRFAYDAYRRLIQLFANIAMDADMEHFERILAAAKTAAGVRDDTELSEDDLVVVVERYKGAVRELCGRPFPQDVLEQLTLAVDAVFGSWMGKRAQDYRREFGIGPDQANGTAVNICTMVFGNMGSDSGTGVAFTRDPGTGENALYGEYLVNAQGEDVVAGIRTPKPLAQLENEMPRTYVELQETRSILEKHHREVQDFEFTFERGKLYLLQTRNGKMNASAFVRTSCEMHDEGLLSREEALLRIQPDHLEQLLHPRIDPSATATPIASGLPASPGAASGVAVFDADSAERRGRHGEAVILVREETRPDDIHGFFRSVAILTSRGGKTSHAAVVARGMGKPCVVGAESLHINDRERYFTVGEHTVVEGQVITIDGASGGIYLGELPTLEPEFGGDVQRMLRWADEIRTLGVRANADTPKMATNALKMGAEGIGLCRTERMFNAADRLPIMRQLILTNDADESRRCIEQLQAMQKSDFIEILRTMAGRPVTIRLLDPPLHEFLPSVESLTWEVERLREVQRGLSAIETSPDVIREIIATSHPQEVDAVGRLMEDMTAIKSREIFDEVLSRREEMLAKVREITEVNPMLGHRGVRLGISRPEIYRMQVEAIYEATAELRVEGVEVHPEVMVPQVCTAQELMRVLSWIGEVHDEVKSRYGVEVDPPFGTMIEVVRACMRAGPLARLTRFFSFGTNDLTQATFSFSREDAEKKFLPLYNEMRVLMDNPFEVLDVKGVGRLMDASIRWGRLANPDLKVGICGEHGGEPRSIEFCHNLGLTYVSCSAYRVPIARLTAAQAKLRDNARDPEIRKDPDFPFNMYK